MNAVDDQAKVDEFFGSIKSWGTAYKNNHFNCIAFRKNDRFYIIQAALSLNTGAAVSSSYFESANVRAGRYPLHDLGVGARQLIDGLLTSGGISTPQGFLYFPAAQAGSHGLSFLDFHPFGLQNQNRLNVLKITGAAPAEYLRQPLFDWELKAASPPYDGVQELMFEYNLGAFRGDFCSVEVIAFNVAVVEFASEVKGTKARPAMRIANGLSTSRAALGYRVFSQGRVVARSRINASEMKWTQEPDFQRGVAEIEVPQGAVLHCVAIYDGVAQQFGWLSDPATVQNARRTVYEAFDPGLETLKDIVSKTQGRGLEARDLESAVAWLLWMLGFSVAHLGGTRRTQEAVDLVAVAPNGHFAVIECTTGLLKSENKLPLLHDRAQAARRALEKSENRNLALLPVLVTSKTKDEVRPDLEQAEKLGILVMTREDLEEGITRTMVIPNADQLIEQAQETVRAAKAKYESDATLPLPFAPLNN
jgi:hypothetical protein